MQEELDKAKQLIEKAEGILAQVDEIQKTVNEINIDSIMNDATSRVTTAAKAVIEEEKDKISTNILVKKVINDYLTEEKENELIQEIIKRSELDKVTNPVKTKIKSIQTVLNNAKLTE